MDQIKNLQNPGIENRGLILAEYRRKLSTQIFFIVFFAGLFVLGMDASILHKIITDAPLKGKVAGLVDMVFSVAVIIFVVRRMILNRAPITVFERGLLLTFTELRTKTVFIPWNKILGMTMGLVRVQMVYKLKYLIARVEPGFPLPKRSKGMLNLAANDISAELNGLTKKPEEILQELGNYLHQFAGAGR